ncbi:MAG: hypothetical protein P4M02_02825 [Clostridia bacterium]|nr:hypothetical protein [Clostridia bacterium]
MPGNHGRFGINIIKYCREHEAYIKERLTADTDLEGLLSFHDKKIAWLQHERLVHLIVTVLTALLFLFLFALTWFIQSLLIFVLLGLVAVLLTAYLIHYFRLENTTQRWYLLSDEIFRRLNGK